MTDFHGKGFDEKKLHLKANLRLNYEIISKACDLPKIHKESVPIRIVVAGYESPVHEFYACMDNIWNEGFF